VRQKASIEEQAIKALLRRKGEYERYFDSLRDKDEKMDNQAQNAYTSIIKTLVELSRKAAPPKRSAEEIQRAAEEVLRNDYGIDV
jgi:hypothetical protein